MNSNLANKEDILDNVLEFKEPKLQLIKTDGDIPEENWLRDLEPGTEFFSREKNSKQFVLEKFIVIQHVGEVVTELLQFAPTGQQLKFGVNSLEFSRNNKLVEISRVFEMVNGPDNEGEGHAQVSREVPSVEHGSEGSD